MKFYTNVYYDGNNALVREITDQRVNKTERFKPSVFILTDKNTKYKTVDGKNTEKIELQNSFDLSEFKERYKDVRGFEIHGDIGTEYQYINQNYEAEFEYDYSLLKILYIDIETTCEEGFPDIQDPREKVIAITCKIDGNITVFCLGSFHTDRKNIEVRQHCDEKDLLYNFIQFMANTKPDIISGWSVKYFDIPYLVNRIKSFEDDALSYKKLSPWGIVKQKFITRNGKETCTFNLIGISVLDYYELYKTFTYTNQESYALDHIAWVELGDRKISYTDYDNISDFYKNNFQLFIEYNIKDVELVEKLENKMRLMELAVALAYSAGVNFTDVFSQVRTWDVIIYNHLMRRNIIIPSKKDNDKNDQYAGAYVKDPLVGMHNWIVSFDIASMYPSSIMQFNISPETYRGQHDIKLLPEDITSPRPNAEKIFLEAKSKNFYITANGTYYDNTKQGFLAELMDKMFKERKTYKNKMIEAKKNLEEINKELQKRGLLVK